MLKLLSLNLSFGFRYVESLRTFGSADEFKVYGLTFRESFETVSLDCAVMNENISVCGFRLHEAEAFCVVEPFNGAFYCACHKFPFY